jgi:light-regulated signal transduction histidine kinase (bacteriophytochrome)
LLLNGLSVKENATNAVREGLKKASRITPAQQPATAPPEESSATEHEVELAVYRQALERSRADMQAFAYSVSHDLRAPLRAIQGFSKILIEDFSASLDAEGQQFLRHIIQNTQQLTSQMDDLLRFSRAGRAAPTKMDLDATELMNEVLEQLRDELPVNLKISVGQLPQVFADPVMLRQVFSEIISNAAKFTSKATAPELKITSHVDEHAATISFCDNGVGFEPGHSCKLFQVFQKLHSPTEYPGNGIGLAIVRRVIEAQGGCADGEGTPDGGARFSISLPHASETLPLQCVPKTNGSNNTVEISA